MVYLNKDNMYNLSIEGLTINYTRLIDNKIYSITIECVSSEDVVEKLHVLSGYNNDTFKVVWQISKDLEDE